MYTRRLLALWITAAMLGNGCAWVHQNATLKLDPPISPSNVGSGATVAVKVIDKRPTKILGYRGLDSKNAEITTQQDVVALFRDNILEGLARKGFTAVPYAEQPGRIFTIEIRQIEYTTDMEFWKGIIRTKAALRALCTRDGVPYDQTYVGERKDTAVEAPRAKTNEKLINGAISDVVQRLFEDERLMLFLAN